MATERYQSMGAEEDAYAEPTSAYQNLFGALQALLAECNFQQSDDKQPGLFNKT